MRKCENWLTRRFVDCMLGDPEHRREPGGELVGSGGSGNNTQNMRRHIQHILRDNGVQLEVNLITITEEK